MNSKVLSILGVLVAALAAILVVSILNAPSTSVEVETIPAVESATDVLLDATRTNEQQGVTTSVNVADHDVVTQVKVKE